MSMKDLLSKMTELQGTVESVEVAPVTATGKKVLNESSNTMKESTKPSLKSIFSSLLSEAEQVTIQPAKQNTQVIKQGQKTLGTVENPQLAQQIKQSIGKGEMSLAGDELQEDDMEEGTFGQNRTQYPIGSTVSDKYGNKYKVLGHNERALLLKGTVDGKRVILFPHQLKQGMSESKLTEKAVSKSQQQAAGAALAAKRGDAPKSKLKGASKEMAKMPAKELEKFAKTKHKGLPEKKKTDEAAMPTHDGDFGAGLGAGRNSKTLESKKAKPDYIDLDKDGNKKESMKKAAADNQKVSTTKKTNESLVELGVGQLGSTQEVVAAKKAYNIMRRADKEYDGRTTNSYKEVIALIKPYPKFSKVIENLKEANKYYNMSHRYSLLAKKHDQLGNEEQWAKYNSLIPEYQDPAQYHHDEAMRILQNFYKDKKVSTMKKTNDVKKTGKLRESIDVELGTPEHKVIMDLINGNLDAYDVMNHPRTSAQKNVADMMQDRYDDITTEYPLHADDDFEKILEKLVDELADDYDTPGYSQSMNEAKKAKPDFLDLDKDGNKKESMKKAAADKKKKTVSEGAGALSIARRTAREIIDMYGSAILKAIDKRGDEALIKLVESFFSKSVNPAFDNVIQITIRELKRMIQTNNSAVKESSKTLKTDRKLVKEGANPTEAARLLGKAHAMGKDPFACKYETGTPEAQAYLDGYKEGLDECYGSGGNMGMAQDMSQDIGMMPGMNSMVSMNDTPSLRGGSDFEVDSMDDMGSFGGFDSQSDDTDMMAFEAWDRQLNELLNEGKMKDLDMDLGNAKGEPALSDAKFKEKYGKTKAEMKKSLASDSKNKTPVKEGISVSVSKGQQNTPDSVTITAQDQEADTLLAMIKQAGLGLFGGDEPSGYGSPVSAATQPIGDVGDHDSMMALIKKMSSTGNDYEDEESQDDQHAHGHPDAACDNCGSATCEGGSCSSSSKETMMGEDETEDQMEFEVAEANAPDSGEAEERDEETTDATRDAALSTAAGKNFANTDAPDDEEEINEGQMKRMAYDKAESMNKEEYISWAADNGMDRSEAIEFWNNVNDDDDEKLNEWANDAGYTGSENTKDNTFEQDIEFMTRIISGGLNGPKKDQTTLPHTRVKVDESRQAINDWKKLSGIK